MTKLPSRRRLQTAAARPAGVARDLLALHLALSPLLFWRGVHDPFELIKLSALVLAAILLTAIAVTRGVLPPVREWRLTAVGVGLFLASAAASTAGSLSWRHSLGGTPENRFGLLAIVALAVLFVGTRTFCRTAADRLRLLAVIPIAGALAGGYALVQAAGLDPLAWDNVSTVAGRGRPAGPLGHPNLLAAFLAMALPVTLAGVRQHIATDRRRAAAYGLAALIELTAVGVSLSRAAWLATAAAGLVLLLGWRPRWKWVAGGAAVALVVVVAIGAMARGAVVERVRHLTDASGRPHIWRGAWAIFCERPLLGCGPEAFQLAFPPHRTPAFWAVEWGTTPAKAHNAPLHLLATQGLLGVAAALVLGIGLVRDARAAWRQPDQRDHTTAILAGLAAFAVQAQFGFTTIGVGTLAVTLTALLGPPADAAAVPPRWSRLRLAVWLPAAWLVYRLVWLPLAAASACRDGDQLLPTDPRAAVAAFALASELEPGCDGYWSRRGNAALALGRWADARTAFTTAAELAPASAFHRHNLGLALADIAPGEAFAAFDVALQRDPANVEFALDAARAALRAGDADRADRYITHGLDRSPNFAPLQAEAAYLALLRNQPAGAVARLDAALAADWHGDAAAAQRAAAVRAEVLRRISRQ